MIRRPTRATLFAYTTLFRSHPARDPCCCRPPPQRPADSPPGPPNRSEEHTSELQSHSELVCRLLREKKKPSVRPGISRLRSPPAWASWPSPARSAASHCFRRFVLRLAPPPRSTLCPYTTLFR